MKQNKTTTKKHNNNNNHQKSFTDLFFLPIYARIFKLAECVRATTIFECVA